MTTSTHDAALSDRVALVTGGGRGLGRAFALALAEAGADVAVLARTTDEVPDVADRIRAEGRQATAVVADVAEPDQVAAAVDQVERELGPIDVLINNAGVVWPLGRLHEIDPDAWREAVRINVDGPFLLTRAVLAGMRERGWGRIITLSSGAGRKAGMPSANAYSVSKAAVDMLMANLATELEGTGVTVANLVPGPVAGSMQDYIRAQDRDAVDPALHERFTALYREGKLGDTQRPAALLVAMVLAGVHGETVDLRTERAGELLGD